MKRLALPLACLGLFTAGTAFAQAQIVPSDTVKGVEKADLDGWVPFLSLTSTLALVSNDSVVGQVDGFSTLFGLGVTGGADYTHDNQVLRTTLTLNESFARTPVVDQFVKTNDLIKLEGLYSYFATKDFGAFGRLSLSTALFKSEDVRGVATTWVEKQADGTLVPLVMNGFRQRVAGAFSPFTIAESAGGFFEPLRGDALSLSVRVGVGGRHTFADGVLANADDKATPEIEMIQLSDVHQLGLEGFAGAVGKLNGGKANYKAGLSILFPFVNNDKDDRSTGALTRIGFEGALTFNVYAWMSLVYSLNITRDPQLFSRGQEQLAVQNTLLLTFQFSVVKKPDKPKDPTKEELELKAEKERADAAEHRAQEAEQKLRAQQVVPVVPPPTPVPDAPPPAP